jgi:hypothetical protein
MPDRNKLYVYFQTYHGPIVPVDDLFVCRCPICGKPKFVISFRYLTGKCLNGCFNGFLIDSIKDYHGISYSEAQEFVESTDSYNEANVDKEDKQAKIKLPGGYRSLLASQTRIDFNVRQYLKDKNLDLNYLDRIGVGICEERIIVPLRCRGVLVAYITQDLKNNSGVYLGSGKRASEWMFNEEALFLSEKIYLCTDYLEASVMGPNGIALKNNILGTIQKNNLIKSGVKEIVIVPLDYSRTLQLTKDLMKYKKVKLLSLDYFIQHWIGTRPSEVGKENIERIEETTEYATEKFLFHQNKIFLDKRIELRKHR